MARMLRLKVAPREVLRFLRERNKQEGEAQAVSWFLLEQKEACIREGFDDGDSADTNVALRIFEDALDWRIGLAVMNLIRATWKHRRRIPKPFTLEVRRDKMTVVFESGRRYDL